MVFVEVEGVICYVQYVRLLENWIWMEMILNIFEARRWQGKLLVYIETEILMQRWAPVALSLRSMTNGMSFT